MRLDSEWKEGENKRAREGEGRIAERRLIKLADTEEGNVDIIRNIRDAVKVIRFHIRGIPQRAECCRGRGAGAGPKGLEEKTGDKRGRVEKDGAHLAAVRGLSLGLFFLFAVSSQVSTIH